MADGLLLAAAAASAAIALAWLLGRTISAGRLMAYLMMALAGAFSLSMLVVTANLSYKVWTDVAADSSGGAAKKASAVPVAAASTAAAAATSDNGTDAVANAMTAISVVVAVLALMLSIGTSWFTTQIQRVKAAEEDLERVISETAQERDFARKSRETTDALIAAREALTRWVDECDSNDQALTVQIFANKLEMLASADRMLRLNAFTSLQVLTPHRLHEPCNEVLKPVEQYTRMCHELELQRQALDAKARSPHAPALARPDEGLWCLLFDPVERFRYETLMRRG